MKKIFTPFLMMLLMFVLAPQANAQKFYNRGADPVSEIQVGTNYMLASPWVGDANNLCGTIGTETPIEDAVYQFVEAGADDNGAALYRLLQVSTGKYLEDPDLSNGQISMTDAVARAFVFTAKLATGMEATYNGDDGKNYKADGWDAYIEQLNTDPSEVYDNKSTEGFEDAFVLCNKNYAKSDRKTLCMYYGPSWDQWAAERIFHIFEAEKASAYDDLCQAIPYLLPNGVEGLFSEGSAPGQVASELVQELNAAYEAASALVNAEGEADEVYNNAIERLSKALKACQDGFVPVTAGYYVIDNSPAGGRPAYAGTNNACLTDTLGKLHWAGFNKPEVMTVEGAAYIWEVIPAEDGGWYLRNFGTKRYAGSLNQNYQAVPSSAEATQVYDINFRKGEYFSLDMRGQNADFPSLHADQNTDMKIVIWEPNADASQWKFIPVDKSELDGIEDQLAQAELNKAAKSLVNQAKADYKKGFTYTSEGCSRDGVFNVGDGLITEAAGEGEEGGQLISNAMESPANEPGNCYKNLLDGVFTTYFHTVWSSADYASSFHYLDIKLNEAVKDFNIKYAKRHNNQNGSPTKIHVYASNDTTNGNWTDQGYMTCTYPWEADVDGTTKSNYVGIAGHQMDAEYTYVRLSVEGTEGMSKTNDNLYWYWSELRMYKATYDPSLSLIEAVPAEVKEEMLKQIAAVEAELAAGNVSQASVDALQASYDKFLENYPDPQIVKNLLNEAQAQAEGAEEGEELGFFEPGAGEALAAVVEEVSASVKDVMTVQEVNDAKNKLNEALAAFNAKLNVPENNLFCYIKCATTSEQEGSAMDNYLYAQNNDESQVKFGDPEDMGDKFNYLWKVIKYEDGSYSFMNCATGTYLGNPKENNVKVNMSLDADTVSLRSAKVGGIFNFVLAENVFFNAQPGTNNLVTWNSANGQDNSAFIIEPAEDAMSAWDGASVDFPVSGQTEVISFAFNIVGGATGGTLYKVLGVKEGMLQLKAYGEKEMIPAATPFIFVPEEGAEKVVFFTDETPKEEMTYVFEGKEQNGLQACLQSTSEIAGGGIFFEGNVISATESDKVKANSGYFKSMPSATTEDGDLSVKFPENITGIEDMFINVDVQGGIYSLTGVKVRNNNNVQGLPKGIYIVGGHKVLVK